MVVLSHQQTLLVDLTPGPDPQLEKKSNSIERCAGRDAAGSEGENVRQGD